MKDIANEDELQPRRTFFWKLKNFYQAIKPVITAHHPLCEYYNEHTFKLRGRKFCIGCYIGYPSAFLTLIFGYISGLFLLLSTSLLFIIGGILFSSLILSIFGLTKRKFIKILSKILLGSSTAFIIAGIFSFPLNFWLKLIQSFLFFQAIVGLMTIKRKKEMDRTCEACPWKKDWNKCPGMSQVSYRLKKI